MKKKSNYVSKITIWFLKPVFIRQFFITLAFESNDFLKRRKKVINTEKKNIRIDESQGCQVKNFKGQICSLSG